jgi:hypothetical protein
LGPNTEAAIEHVYATDSQVAQYESFLKRQKLDTYLRSIFVHNGDLNGDTRGRTSVMNVLVSNSGRQSRDASFGKGSKRFFGLSILRRLKFKKETIGKRKREENKTEL